MNSTYWFNFKWALTRRVILFEHDNSGMVLNSLRKFKTLEWIFKTLKITNQKYKKYYLKKQT